MKLSDSLNAIFNEQILHEYRNQLIYTQIESAFESMQLKNISRYFNEQSIHEKEHGDLVVNHLNSRTGGNVDILTVGVPEFSYDDPHFIADLYVSTEEGTTESLESIYEFTLKQKSYIDLPFILKMLEEQVEEEDSANVFSLNLKQTKDIVLFDKMLFEEKSRDSESFSV